MLLVSELQRPQPAEHVLSQAVSLLVISETPAGSAAFPRPDGQVVQVPAADKKCAASQLKHPVAVLSLQVMHG